MATVQQSEVDQEELGLSPTIFNNNVSLPNSSSPGPMLSFKQDQIMFQYPQGAQLWLKKKLFI